MTAPDGNDPFDDLFGDEREQPLERASMADQAVTAIKDMIVSGELQPGQTLPAERQLAQLLEISRPTLRQAISALSAMNIVESRHGGGTYVTALTPAMLTEPISFLLRVEESAASSLFEVRRVLEVSAAGLAAERITDDALVNLGRLLEIESTTVGDQDRFLVAGTRFHDLIVKAVDNELYAALYASIARLSEPARRAEAASPTVRRRAHREHAAILNALRDHDTAAAIEAMRTHLDALRPRSRVGGRVGNRPPRG